DDRGIREPGKSCWRSVPNSVLRDPPQQAAEYERVERQHPVPKEAARNPFGMECCRLADQRTRAPVERVDPELQPAAARQLQSGRQAQHAIRLEGFRTPTLDEVADGTVAPIAPGPA